MELSDGGNTVLVVAAHPDDEVLGCGGTIARLADEGLHVCVCILGEGLTSRTDRREMASRGDLDGLHACSRRAAAHLGVQDVCLHDLPDNRFDTVALLDVVKIIERHITELRPSAVFTHHAGDLNMDHVITCRATLIATRPVSHDAVPAVYAYEVLRRANGDSSRSAPHSHPIPSTMCQRRWIERSKRWGCMRARRGLSRILGPRKPFDRSPRRGGRPLAFTRRKRSCSFVLSDSGDVSMIAAAGPAQADNARVVQSWPDHSGLRV